MPTSSLEALSSEETAEWMRRSIAEAGADDEEPTEYWFAITRLETGELLGEIGLVDLVRTRPPRRAEHPRPAGGRRIEMRTLPENQAMQRLAEATGFTREGVLRSYGYERGRFVDNFVYSRLPGQAAAGLLHD